MVKRPRKTTKKSKVKQKYICSDCGTEITLDCFGIDFNKLVCCGKEMKKIKGI